MISWQTRRGNDIFVPSVPQNSLLYVGLRGAFDAVVRICRGNENPVDDRLVESLTIT